MLVARQAALVAILLGFCQVEVKSVKHNHAVAGPARSKRCVFLCLGLRGGPLDKCLGLLILEKRVTDLDSFVLVDCWPPVALLNWRNVRYEDFWLVFHDALESALLNGCRWLGENRGLLLGLDLGGAAKGFETKLPFMEHWGNQLGLLHLWRRDSLAGAYLLADNQRSVLGLALDWRDIGVFPSVCLPVDGCRRYHLLCLHRTVELLRCRRRSHSVFEFFHSVSVGFKRGQRVLLDGRKPRLFGLLFDLLPMRRLCRQSAGTVAGKRH